MYSKDIYIYSFSWRFNPNCYICQRSGASAATRG